MGRNFFLIALLLLVATAAQAQMKKTLYQVFEIDSFSRIDLEMADLSTLEYWGGNSILVETNIELTNATPEIVNFLIQQNRYQILSDTVSKEAVRLFTKERPPMEKGIKTPSGGKCSELTTARIYVPDTFYWSDDKKMLTRREKRE
jgi:hypothetical protein